MKGFGVGGYFTLCGCAAVAILAGCGGSQQPIGALRAMPQSPAISTHVNRAGSWMLPEAKNSDLLYVADYESNEVSVLELPQGKLLGVLTGFNGPYGECTDGNGDVFVADFNASQIWEYRRGARSPKAILSDPEYGPIGCSVDPTTGALAVTNATKIEGSSGPGNVAIFAHASRKPKFYFDRSISQFGYCAYDNLGNLYAGGSDSSKGDLFAELLKGQTKLTALTLNVSVSGESPMQWDGQDLAIAAGSPGSLIYRFKIKGSAGKAIGVLKLKRASEILDFAIQGASLYAPLYNQNEVRVYLYPQGGKASITFLGFGEPVAAAVSVAPK